MLTHEEKIAARMLGEAAATTVALDALEKLYKVIEAADHSIDDDTLKAWNEAGEVLHFAGRLDQD